MTKIFERNAVLVTGGAIRLGRAITLALARQGYDVAIHYHSSREEAEKTAVEIRNHGVRCELFQADLRNIDAIPEFFRSLLSRFPRTQALVNNASRFKPATIRKTEPALFAEMLTINLTAPFLLMREFARHRNSGAIINILDTKISANDFDYAAYYLAKKALGELTKMAALEFAPAIRVNAVAPGPTIPTAGTGMSEFDEKTIAAVPLQRTASPKNVTQAVVHLLENDFINGHILTVDGGESLSSGSGLAQSKGLS